MAKFILTNKAIEDLSKIWNYTFDTWSEAQADKYYLMILDACQELAAGKLSGKMYPELGDDVYGFKVSRHIIFYKKANRHHIEVARILHSRMDLKNRLQE